MTLKSSVTCFESYFCAVDVTDGKMAKRGVWSPKYQTLLCGSRSCRLPGIRSCQTDVETAACSLAIERSRVPCTRAGDTSTQWLGGSTQSSGGWGSAEGEEEEGDDVALLAQGGACETRCVGVGL